MGSRRLGCGGLIYYARDSTRLPNATHFVAAFDEQGNPQPLTGSFPVSNPATDIGPTGMTYDAQSGLIYVAGAYFSQSEPSNVAAFDEQGNSQTLSPGFPNTMETVGSIRFDANDGLLYVATWAFSGKGGPTITAWDGQGNPQALSGHFDYPHTGIYDYGFFDFSISE